MPTERFDALTRAAAGAGSRRTVIKLMLGGVAGGALTALLTGKRAEAKPLACYACVGRVSTCCRHKGGIFYCIETGTHCAPHDKCKANC